MTEEPQSLIIAAESSPAQLSFFEENAYEILESANGGHEFTGERLFARDRERYNLCVRMIAEGLATRQIARALQVSANTVEAVRRREQIPVEAEKQQILNSVRVAARLSVERVIEMAPTMTGRDAAITAGIMIEKMQLLSGEATSIVGKEETIRHADFNAMIEALPLANAHEVPAEMGYSAGSQPQKEVKPDIVGGAAVSPELPNHAASDLGALATPSDEQSPALQSKSASDHTLDHISASESPELAGPARGGGRV